MIDPMGIPVVEGDPDALARHASDLVSVGGAFADTGARVNASWQALAPAYVAPESDQLLAATGPVQQVSASVGEDITTVGQALGRYADELRELKARLDALRVDATVLVTELGGAEPDADQAERSNELLSAVNVAVADFDDAQRRCANAINALYGGTRYRADDGDGVQESGEYGATAEMLDEAAANGGLAWGGVAQAADDGDWLSDLGHTALDIVGLVPVVGEIADAANAVWYAAEGDYANAALSAAAMVPVAGWVATGGKFGIRGAKAVLSVNDARIFARGRSPLVPDDATRLPFSNPRYSGERYEWIDQATGKKVRYEAHGRDPSQDPTTNAGAGPVYRERIGNHYVDGQGNTYTKNSVDPNSSAYSEKAANATHVPYPKGLPPPGGRRVVVPNPAALGDPVGTGE